MCNVTDIRDLRERRAWKIAVTEAEKVKKCTCAGECECGANFMANFLRALHGMDNKAPSDQ